MNGSASRVCRYANCFQGLQGLQRNSLYRAARIANVEGKRRRDCGLFCSVDHFSEGGVNANHNITCSPSLAENDSRLFKNNEGNRDGQWIFDEGRRETLLYSC